MPGGNAIGAGIQEHTVDRWYDDATKSQFGRMERHYDQKLMTAGAGTRITGVTTA